MSKRRIWQVSLVVGALMAIAGVAAASEHEDTVVNFGYDEENHILVFNTSSTEGNYDCTLQTAETNGDYEIAYVTDEGTIEVEGLTSGGSDVTFSEREGEGTADYATATECQLQATEIAGPNGQINHGMFMKALTTLYEGPHRGCVVRHFAGSTLGMDDQQIRTSDADPEFEPFTGEEPYQVTFTSVLTDCEKNGADTANGNGNGNGNGKGKGRPESKGRPDSPGKSGSAPGRAGR